MPAPEAGREVLGKETGAIGGGKCSLVMNVAHCETKTQ